MSEYIIHSFYSFIHKETMKEYMVTCTVELDGIRTTINQNLFELYTPKLLVNFKRKLDQGVIDGTIINFDIGMLLKIQEDNKQYKIITD